MKKYKRVLLIPIVATMLASCSSLESLMPSSMQPKQNLRPAPSVPEVIPSAAGTPQPETTTPPTTDLNAPTATTQTPDAATTPASATSTTTQSQAPTTTDTTDQPSSNVIPVGKSVAPTNIPPLKKKTPPPSGPSVLPQPNLQ